MFLAIFDEEVALDTYVEPTIITLEEFTLEGICKVLDEMCFGFHDYSTPDPAYADDSDYGSFEEEDEDERLDYIYSNGVTLGEILSGKANTLVLEDDSYNRDVPRSQRVRFMTPKDYNLLLNKEYSDRLNKFNSIIANPSEHTIERHRERSRTQQN